MRIQWRRKRDEVCAAVTPGEAFADDLVCECDVAGAGYAFEGIWLGAVEADFSFADLWELLVLRYVL